MKKRTNFGRRMLAFGLCLTVLLAGRIPSAAAEPVEAEVAAEAVHGSVQYGVRLADPSSMDSYVGAMLDETNGSRYAGRVWSDKTVFAYDAAQDRGGLEDNVLALDMDTDGYDGKLSFDSDFLNVYSTLASSQKIDDNLSTPFDLMIVLDMSGSMAQSTKFGVGAAEQNGYQETMQERIDNSRVQKTLDAVNETIDALMAENRENRVGVCVYGANAAVLMPLAHYQRVNDAPYLSIGGMETLYDRDDYTTPEELALSNPGMTFEDGIWNINRDACYTIVANALYDQSYSAPEVFAETWKRTISNNVKNDMLHPDPDIDGDGRQLSADQYVGYMTNTQGGIYLGMKQLADTADMTFSETLSNGETVTVARVPAIMIMTDGGANFAFNNRSEDAQHELPQNSGEEWYDIYLPQEDITNLYNDGVSQNILNSIPAYNDAGIFYDSDMDVGGTPATILEVLMTASYMKTVVEKHYEQGWELGKASASSRIPLSIYTVSVDAVHLPAWGRYRIYPTMDPEEYFNATRWNDGNYASIGGDFRAPLPWREPQDIQMEDLLPYTYGKWEEWMGLASPDEAISVLADWAGNSESKGVERVLLDDDPSHSVSGCATLRIGRLADGHVYERKNEEGLTAEEIEVTNQDVIDNINYPDRFYDVESEEVSGVFREVVGLLTNSIFEPVDGKNSAGAEDSVTYRDPIGQYMKIQSDAVTVLASEEGAADETAPEEAASDQTYDMAALLFGEMHGLVRGAVYEFSFNEAYVEYNGGIIEDFADGWYKGDDAPAAEYRAPDDAPDDPLAEGWVYRIGDRTLLSALPTLNGAQSLSEEQRRSVYVFYRFVDDAQARDELRINPAYGDDVPVSLESMWNALEEKPVGNELYANVAGVYRLNDIRVWTESTVAEPGSAIEADADVLYVNIPVAALPLQTAEITYGAEGPASFERNWSQKDQSTPFRLFYTVGVNEALIDRDEDSKRSWVDIEALPEEYLESHRGDSFGSTYFYSGDQDDFEGAEEAQNSSDRARGKSIASFSPSEENSYYRYQDVLPLFAHAYRVVDANPNSGDGLACVDKLDGWTGDNAGASNGVTTWENGETGGEMWDGGAYLGTYRDEAAYVAARKALENVEGVEMIRDSYGKLYPFAEDGILLLARDMLTSGQGVGARNGAADFRPGNYYFLVMEHYVPISEETLEGKAVLRVACGRGSELISNGAEGEDEADEGLCWIDYSGATELAFDCRMSDDATFGEPTFEKLAYSGYQLRAYLRSSGVDAEQLDEQLAYWLDMQRQLLSLLDADSDGVIGRAEYDAADFHWVLAARPGGRRTEELYRSVRAKRSNDTQTAYNRLTPTVSVSSEAGSGFIVDEYLGNNGKLTISNSQLFVMNEIDAKDAPTGTEFRYQLFVEGYAGACDAVVVKYDPEENGGSGGWRQQIAALDAHTSDAGLLLTADGQLAAVDRGGNAILADAAFQEREAGYYVYIAPDGDAANQRRIFLSEEAEGYDPTRPLSNMGRRIYAADELSEDSVEKGGYWTNYREAISDMPAGTVEFYCKDVWLVPIASVDGIAQAGAQGAEWQFDQNDAQNYVHIGYGDGAGESVYRDGVEPFVLARLEPSELDSSVQIQSNYWIDVTYLTKELNFGFHSTEDGSSVPMAADDLIDTRPFWLGETTCAGIPGQQRAVMETAEYARAMEQTEAVEWVDWDEIAKHTAEFTLRDGEGLLLNLRPGLRYRATEDGMSGAGFLLKEAVQQSESETVRYALDDMNDPSGCAIISAWRDISGDDADAHKNCERFPNGPDEYAGGEAIRHWIVNGALQMDYSVPNLKALLPKARFSDSDDIGRVYSLYGSVEGRQETARFVNEYQPSTLVIANWLEAAGENVSLTQEDLEQEFSYTLSLRSRDGSGALQITPPFAVSGYEDGELVAQRKGDLLYWQFTLKGNQRMVISGMTEPYSYSIEQSAAPGYIAGGSPYATKDENQAVTVEGSCDAADGAPQIVTFTNRKTVHTQESSANGFNYILWLVLAAALVMNLIAAAVHLSRTSMKRRHRR